MSIRFKTSCSLNYCSFIINPETGKCEFIDLSFISNPQRYSVFNTSLWLFMKQLAEISMGMAPDLKINLRTDILIILCLLVMNKNYILSELFFSLLSRVFLNFYILIYLNLKKKKNKNSSPISLSLQFLQPPICFLYR